MQGDVWLALERLGEFLLRFQLNAVGLVESTFLGGPLILLQHSVFECHN